MLHIQYSNTYRLPYRGSTSTSYTVAIAYSLFPSSACFCVCVGHWLLRRGACLQLHFSRLAGCFWPTRFICAAAYIPPASSLLCRSSHSHSSQFTSGLLLRPVTAGVTPHLPLSALPSSTHSSRLGTAKLRPRAGPADQRAKNLGGKKKKIPRGSDLFPIRLESSRPWREVPNNSLQIPLQAVTRAVLYLRLKRESDRRQIKTTYQSTSRGHCACRCVHIPCTIVTRSK